METTTYIPTAAKTKAIKKALAAHFPAKDISVTKGTGTASHWISSRVTIDRPTDCACDPLASNGYYRTCDSCKAAHRAADTLIDDVAAKALKDIGAGFSSYYSDDYTDSTARDCHSVSVNFRRD